MRTFDDLRNAFTWKEISGCPGRFTLGEPLPEAPPADMAGDGAVAVRLESPACRNPIELIRLPHGGGLLSYRRADGTYCHTLNSDSGLARKLRQLGLDGPAGAESE